MLIASSAIHIDVIVSVLAGIAVIGGSVVAIGKWGHDRIVNSVKEELIVLHAAVTPNGGSSLRDAVDRIEKETVRQGTELDRQGAELDDVSKRLERHLGYHEGESKARS